MSESLSAYLSTSLCCKLSNLIYVYVTTCKWFAYGPADATAAPSSVAPVKSRMVYLSGDSLPRLSWKKAVKQK